MRRSRKEQWHKEVQGKNVSGKGETSKILRVKVSHLNCLESPKEKRANNSSNAEKLGPDPDDVIFLPIALLCQLHPVSCIQEYRMSKALCSKKHLSWHLTPLGFWTLSTCAQKAFAISSQI